MTAARRTLNRQAVWLAAVGLMTTVLVLLKGCAVTVIPPAHVHEPVDVLLVDYGRHPALMLARSETQWVEYSYGEWQWYALNRKRFGDAIRALLINSDGALGRRVLYEPLEAHSWLEHLRPEQMHRITVERERAEALLAALDEQWEGSSDLAVYNHEYQMELVPHPQQYSAVRNSNIMLGDWLEELDCQVRGWPLLPTQWRIDRAAAGQVTGE